MVARNEHDRLGELEALRPPGRSPEQARLTRQRILDRGEPLLSRRRGGVSPWQVLAAWARPGLVAATVALLVVTGALRTWSRERPDVPGSVALEEMLSGAGERDRVPALLVATNEPDGNALVAAALLGNGRIGGTPARDNSRLEEERR